MPATGVKLYESSVKMAATKCFGLVLLMVFILLNFHSYDLNLTKTHIGVAVYSLWINDSVTSLYDAETCNKVVIQFGGLYKVSLSKRGYCKS